MSTLEKVDRLPTLEEFHGKARGTFAVLARAIFQDGSYFDTLKALEDIVPDTICQSGAEFKEGIWTVEYAPRTTEGLGKRMVYHTVNEGPSFITMNQGASASTIAYISTQPRLPEPFGYIIENRDRLSRDLLSQIHPVMPSVPLVEAVDAIDAMHTINTAIVNHTE